MSLELNPGQEVTGQLSQMLAEALNTEQADWLQSGIGKLLDNSTIDLDQLTRLLAQSGRKLGKAPLPATQIALAESGLEFPAIGWDTRAAGRVLLLLQGTSGSPTEQPEIIHKCYRSGDEIERSTIVRALCLFPNPKNLIDLALEAGRANSPPLFSALSIGNPYPAAEFSPSQFNQMVLKVLFMGLPCSKIINLEQRTNAELSRMCEDYFQERLAANRTLPVDGWLALAPYASADGEDLLFQHLSHHDIGHRYFSAIATGKRSQKHPELLKHLKVRLDREQEQPVLDVLQTFLENPTA